jgi:crotonobetainyl-CoA:carnitine CoA-transferase CaiB-like acyl-CoA transferase
VLELASGDGRNARVTGNPMKFQDTAPEEKNYPRALGADTAAVLRDVLDLSPEAVAELIRSKAIIAREMQS